MANTNLNDIAEVFFTTNKISFQHLNTPKGPAYKVHWDIGKDRVEGQVFLANNLGSIILEMRSSKPCDPNQVWEVVELLGNFRKKRAVLWDISESGNYFCCAKFNDLDLWNLDYLQKEFMKLGKTFLKISPHIEYVARGMENCRTRKLEMIDQRLI